MGEVIMKYLMDTHMHSIYSYDGQMTIEGIAKKATSLGLNAVAITEHLELDSISLKQFINRYKLYKEEIMRVQEIYPNLKILKAIEIGNPEKHETEMHTIQELDLDYIIGSNHILTSDIRAYYETILKIARQGLVDSIGHLDYIRRKYPDEAPADLINQIFETMVKNNITLEVNSSAKRRLNEEGFPKSELIDLYLNNFDNRITLGSDAHRDYEIYDGISELDDRIKADKGYYLNRKFISIQNKK